MKNEILAVFIKYKPAGLQDIADWVDHGRWVEFALKAAEEERTNWYYLRKCIQHFEELKKDMSELGEPLSERADE